MQGAREIAITLLLLAHGRMPVRDLAQALKVSERTIARDRAELALAGITITTSRGPGGGYALAPGTSIDLGHFARKVAQGASASGTNATPTQEIDVDTEQALRLALRAIEESLSDGHREAFVRAMREVFIAPPRAVSQGEDASLYAVRQALWRRLRLRIHYARQDGTISERLVEPYVLLSHEGSLYLVGYCHWRQDVRTFALTRIERAEIADGVAGVPDTIELPKGTPSS